jgi:hypothetical protein
MSIGALSTNAAAHALLASPVSAPQNRAGGAQAASIDPLSPSAKAQRHDHTLHRYRAPDEQGGEGKSQRARRAGQAAPTHLKVVSPQNSDASASTLFVAQVLSQDGPQAPGPGLPAIGHAIEGHRDSAELGSLHYRTAGGEPQVLGTNATLLSLSV